MPLRDRHEGPVATRPRGAQVGAREVARRHEGTLVDRFRRVGDEPFRFGGDEFVLLLSDADGAGALVVAQRIQDIYQTMGQTLRGTDVAVSFSIGIAVFPEDGATPEALMERADGALLDAKRTGPAKILRYQSRAAA